MEDVGLKALVCIKAWLNAPSRGIEGGRGGYGRIAIAFTGTWKHNVVGSDG